MTHPTRTAQPPARRAFSLLLTLVLTATLFCALALAAPVTAQAATYGDGTIISSDATVTGQSFAGTITINPGVTLTLGSGCTLAGNTTFTGGGNLVVGYESTPTAHTLDGDIYTLDINVAGSVTIRGINQYYGINTTASITIQNSANVTISGGGAATFGLASSKLVKLAHCAQVTLIVNQGNQGRAIVADDLAFVSCPSVTINSDTYQGGISVMSEVVISNSHLNVTASIVNSVGIKLFAGSIRLDGGSLAVNATAASSGGIISSYNNDPGAGNLVVPVMFGPGGGRLQLQGPKGIYAEGLFTSPRPTSQMLRVSRDGNGNPWQLIGPAASSYSINPAANLLELDYTQAGGLGGITLTVAPQSPQTADPTQTADPSLDATGVAHDFESAAYYARHYNYWLGALTQLNALGHSGTITMDTHGHGIDHIQHFVFDALVGTSRTLVVRHRGEVYTIRGRAESAGGKMGGIALGHNHSFDILGAYKSGNASNTASSTQRG